jgi:hypothetical protein
MLYCKHSPPTRGVFFVFLLPMMGVSEKGETFSHILYLGGFRLSPRAPLSLLGDIMFHVKHFSNT